MTFSPPCPICRKITVIEVDEQDFIKWNSGMLIQNAFPYLDANQREILKTGICPDCFDKVAPKPKE